MIGRALKLRAKLRPSGSGTMRIRIWRSGHELAAQTFGDHATLHLSTRRVAEYKLRIIVTPAAPYSPRKKSVHASVFLPYLGLGARGPSVRILERRLAQLHYTTRGVDGFYSYDTADAVMAFQKLNGLARTGRVTPVVWRRLQGARSAAPRYRPGHHFEVNKTKQVLFEVDRRPSRADRPRLDRRHGEHADRRLARLQPSPRDAPGRHVLLVLSSCAASRSTATRRCRRTRPRTAACRVPHWVAPLLFATSYYGEAIYVYY